MSEIQITGNNNNTNITFYSENTSIRTINKESLLSSNNGSLLLDDAIRKGYIDIINNAAGHNFMIDMIPPGKNGSAGYSPFTLKLPNSKNAAIFWKKYKEVTLEDSAFETDSSFGSHWSGLEFEGITKGANIVVWPTREHFIDYWKNGWLHQAKAYKNVRNIVNPSDTSDDILIKMPSGEKILNTKFIETFFAWYQANIINNPRQFLIKGSETYITSEYSYPGATMSDLGINWNSLSPVDQYLYKQFIILPKIFTDSAAEGKTITQEEALASIPGFWDSLIFETFFEDLLTGGINIENITIITQFPPKKFSVEQILELEAYYHIEGNMAKNQAKLDSLYPNIPYAGLKIVEAAQSFLLPVYE